MRYANWRELVEECRQSGKKQRDWCEEKGISVSTYRKWITRIGKCEQATKWATIKSSDVKEQKTVSEPEKSIFLKCGKWTINVFQETDTKLLLTVLRAVNSVC